jgi:4-hydroxy-4-methyl-2-oxoglutarate aldolase|tara:strand:+ start:1213 stop:1905 length:693 start_codon:yes stop_codon:yes gene_type:complete
MYQLNSKDIKLFSKLYAGVIYDALVFDLNYKKPFLLDSCIKKVSGNKKNYIGPAFTCTGKTVKKTSEIKDHIRIEMFKEFFKGCFQVISTGGDDTVAHFGDISGLIAKKFGAIGVVMDGNTRDIDLLKKNNFPVFCKDIFPVDAYGSWQIIDYGKPIIMKGKKGSVQVNQGDIIFADSDAVICIHKNIAKQVLKLSLTRLKRENMIRKEIKKISLKPKNIHKMYKKIGRW